MIFEFTITNAKRMLYGFVASGIQLFSSAYLLLITLQPKLAKWQTFAVLVFSILVIRGIFILVKKMRFATYTHLFIVLILLAVLTHQFFIAVLLSLFTLVECIVNRDWQCISNENGVLIKSMPSKYYAWSALQNVLITNGFFTIDQKNNRIIQIDISKENLPFDIDSFNRFAARKVQ
jgi:hypothetical protein